MKELSVGEKAKAYDNVRGKIAIRFGSNVAKEIFSEYEEDKDERIRKAIRTLILSVPDIYEKIGFSQSDCFAWLEKQGEHKSTDKDEPKFKVGDWIIYKGDIWKICNISLGAYYKLLKINNEVSIRHFEGVDKTAHLWAIQDAKDGDVLATEPIEGCHSPFVAIYKKQNEEDFDSYCFIGFDGKFYKGENGHSTEKVHPATKEQRDTLIKAMADAGYAFDFEKKELKKIEQKPAGCSAYSFEDMYEASQKCYNDKYNKEEYCHEQSFKWGFQEGAEWREEKVEQKPIDESSAFKNKLLELFQKFRYIKEGVPTNGDIIDYVDAHIQELIDTLQNKPWSEEDERMYRGLHNLIYSTPYCDSRKEFSDWLENLKEKLAIMQSQS